MRVIADFPITAIEQAREQPSLTYRLDFDKKRIIGRVGGVDAVNQCIHKMLMTPRFRCLLYDNQYGSEIKSMIGADDITEEFIETELPRMVKDALSVDSRILGIRDFSFAHDGDSVRIQFAVDTIFGETVVEEVL